ncbi:MAG: hypothetical protein M3286_07525 [Thermoproteota archaeon]|nr:hypothetical protein [Thermoproteota archaeon]
MTSYPYHVSNIKIIFSFLLLMVSFGFIYGFHSCSVVLYFEPSALLLLLVEFETILSAIGLCLQMSGATILPTFTVPINIMKITIATNPAFANFLAYEILSSKAKKEEIAKRPTIGTADDTKTDLFGNSNGEKDDMVKSIKIPEITVASTMMISLALRFAVGPDAAE